MATTWDKATYSDPWSFLDFKPSFGLTQAGTTAGGKGGFQPRDWVGPANKRRLQAYCFYDDYYRNKARVLLPQSLSEDERLARREYGDPHVIVESNLSSLLGNDQTIHVDGEESQDADAKEQGDLLRTWVDQERFTMKLFETERGAIKNGDGVYALGWDKENERPSLVTYDPGWYFPVLPTNVNNNEFPTKVNVAWEYERPKANDVTQMETWVYRATWELIDTEDERTYGWNAKPVKKTCMHYAYEWKLDDVKGEVQDFSIARATVLQEPVDMQLDYVPVVHIPNTVAEHDHFGVSSLGPVLQIFDDLVSTDSDLQAAAATTGTPPIVVKGLMGKNEEGEVESYGPGMVIQTENGADIIDTSRSLSALLELRSHLDDRLYINARTPKTLLGAVDPEKVPSGIVLTLSFQPHSSMIREMRLVRKDKYDLLLKFVCRMYMANGKLKKILPAHLKFGSYLPADKQEVMTTVVAGISAVPPVLSQETALRMLMESGIPLESVDEELKRIRENDFDSAAKLLDATGDIDAVRTFLGLPPAPPELIDPNQALGQETPPTPGTNGEQAGLTPEEVTALFGGATDT